LGTRADFYVGRGADAEWLGSVGQDGYPDGISDEILNATSEDEFRKAVADQKEDRHDFTSPEDGWPWLWDDSRTTDYAYAWDGKVLASHFGYEWFDPRGPEPEEESGKVVAVFPNMATRKNVTFGRRSGLIVVTR
jgi:hypothetical protein